MVRRHSKNIGCQENFEATAGGAWDVKLQVSSLEAKDGEREQLLRGLEESQTLNGELEAQRVARAGCNKSCSVLLHTFRYV